MSKSSTKFVKAIKDNNLVEARTALQELVKERNEIRINKIKKMEL